MPNIIRHVIIRGRVQGVGYRAWVAETAAELKLEGWVRNRRDGSVEAVFAGDKDVVDTMVARCRRGPSMSHVDNVQVDDSSVDELTRHRAGGRFSVLGTI